MPRPLVLLVIATLGSGCGTSASAPRVELPAVDEAVADVLAYRGDSARSGRMPWPGPSGEPEVARTYAASGAITFSPVVRQNTVFALSNGVLHAVSLADGKELWTATLGATSEGAPIVVGDEQWRVFVDGTPTIPVVAHGRVVVGSDLGELTAIIGSGRE